MKLTRSPFRRLFLAFICAAVYLFAPALQGQSPFVGPPVPDEPGPSVRMDPIPVPKNEEEIKKRIELTKESIEVDNREIAELKARLEKGEPTDADKALLTALEELVKTLSVYQTQLPEYSEVLLQIHNLEAGTATAQVTQELTAISQAIEEVKNDFGHRPDGVTAEQLQQTEAELETVKTNLATRVKASEDRAKRKTELPARLESLKADIESAQQALNKAAAELEDKQAKLPADSSELRAIDFTVEKLKFDAGLILLRKARLEAEVKRDGLHSALYEQRIPLLRQLVAEHEKRVERYKQLRAQSQIQTAKEELERAKTQPQEVSPYELAFLNMRVRVRQSQQELAEMQRAMGISDRFPAPDFDALKKDLEEDVARWSQYMEVLYRKSGDKIRVLYKRLEQDEAEGISTRDRILTLYDNALDDRVRITDHIDQIVDEELPAAWRNLDELERAESNTETVVRIAPLKKDLRETFEKSLGDIRANLDALVARLAEAGKLLSQHVNYLAAQRSRMYWSYLRVQDQPMWKYRWAETRNEWDTEAAERATLSEHLQKGVDQVTPRSAITASVMLLGVLIGSWVLRNRLLVSADRLEQRIGAGMADAELASAAVSDRLHLQLIRFLARTSPVVLPAAATWLWVANMSPLDGRITATLMAVLILAGVANALISTLFSRSKPRYRLLPCSNVVAAHYRGWLRVLLYVSFVIVPIPLILSTFDGMPYTRNYIWGAYKIVALLIVLAFALPRQTVLRVVGRPQDVRYHLVYQTFSTGYPLLYLGVAALLALQVAGFGPLVTYIIAGIAQSILVIVAAILIVRYLRDVVLRFGQKLALAKEQASGAATVDGEPDNTSGNRDMLLDRQADTFDEKLWLGIGLSIFRWAAAIAAIAMIVSVWGVSRVDMQRALNYALIAESEDRPSITAGRGLAALAVLLFTWLLSKGIRAFLDAQVYPAYTSLDRGGRVAISTLLHYTFVFLGLYFALFIMQIPLGALTVVLGTLGLGLGLGLQPVFINFLSGIIILFERHLKVGDLIEVNGVLGEVSGISLRATTIKTYDNVDMVIPNADFVSGTVINWTKDDPRIRGKIEVGVAYDSDVRLVERLLRQVASESKLVLKEPPPRVRFVQFGDSALNFTLFAWFYNSSDRFDFMTDSRYRILELFRENDITIPFPERTLNINEKTPLRVQVENIAREPEAARRKDLGRDDGTKPESPTEKPAARR